MRKHVTWIILIILTLAIHVSHAATPPSPKMKPGNEAQKERILQEEINKEMSAYIQSTSWCFDTDRTVCDNSAQVDALAKICERHGYNANQYYVKAELFLDKDGTLVLGIMVIMASKSNPGAQHVHIWDLIMDDGVPTQDV